MNIMILGASGQLGREWQQFFKSSTESEHVIFPYTSSQLDVTRPREVASEVDELQPALIINCAAYTNVDGAEEEQERAMEVNKQASGHLAETCAGHRIKLLHYSTDYIFPGGDEDRERFPEGYPEDHPADPVNRYGQSKWEGEEAIRASGCDHLIIRTTWLCGQFGNNFVKTMLRLGKEREEVRVVNDQWGSPSFAGEVVKNSFALVDRDQSGTFHLTSGGLTTWFEFARAIFEYSGTDVSVEPVDSGEFPTKADRPRFSKLSTRKAEGVPGVEIIDWREGLRALLRKIE